MSRRSWAHTAPARTALGGLGIWLGLAGCGGLESVATHEAELDPARLYMALTLDYHAINLATDAPYQTIQLTATPRDARGEAMAGLPAPTFRLATPGDSTVLQVTPDGRLTALAAANNIAVVVELVAPGPVRHEDRALVSITAGAPPVLDQFSVEPTSHEFGVWSLLNENSQSGYNFFLPNLPPPPQLTFQALDPSGQPIPNLVAEYASLDPTRATVDQWTGRAKMFRVGPVAMVARIMAYGVLRADTAVFTVTWPLISPVNIYSGPNGKGIFVPDQVWIVRGGMIFWINDGSDNIVVEDSIDVTFDDPTQAADVAPAFLCDFFPGSCGAGNLLLLDANRFADISTGVRRFSVPGVYTYHSNRTGATGRIIVTDESATPPE